VTKKLTKQQRIMHTMKSWPLHETQNGKTEKEKLREQLEKDTKEFLKSKQNKIEQVPRGVSAEKYELSKKQKERLGNKKEND